MIKILFLSLFGLCIGSFLNVCIYRLPLEQSIVSPPSQCVVCGTRLKLWDLVPVLGFLLAERRCRYCGTAIAWRYIIVELLTAFFFFWSYAVLGFSETALSAFVFVSFLIVITFIDIDHQLILDKVLIVMAVAGLTIRLYHHSSVAAYIDIGISALLGGGLLFFITVATQGMGLGDVKFAAVLGIWLEWRFLLLALFLAFVAGGLTGIALLTLKLKQRKDRIPFGPFLAIGGFISMLYGYDILTWYLKHFW